MKPIKLTQQQWKTVKKKIKESHPPSVLLIREKMKSVLGFTDRSHNEWIEHTNETGGYFLNIVCLDFFDEKQRTMFLLKYGDIFLEKK